MSSACAPTSAHTRLIDGWLRVFGAAYHHPCHRHHRLLVPQLCPQLVRRKLSMCLHHTNLSRSGCFSNQHFCPLQVHPWKARCALLAFLLMCNRCRRCCYLLSLSRGGKAKYSKVGICICWLALSHSHLVASSSIDSTASDTPHGQVASDSSFLSIAQLSRTYCNYHKASGSTSESIKWSLLRRYLLYQWHGGQLLQHFWCTPGSHCNLMEGFS